MCVCVQVPDCVCVCVCRFLKTLSFASLDKEDLLSPISQSSMQRCSSLRSMVSCSYASSDDDDYIGLALPVDINNMFHVRTCLSLLSSICLSCLFLSLSPLSLSPFLSPLSLLLSLSLLYFSSVSLSLCLLLHSYLCVYSLLPPPPILSSLPELSDIPIIILQTK